MIYDDKPISNPKEDILGRGGVAKKLAEAIVAYKEESSFVIGIQGKWGDGKTSFINMMLGEDGPEEQRVLRQDKFLIIKFNPWYFTGDDQVLRQFCGQLSKKIENIPNVGTAAKEAALLIRHLSAVVKPLQPVLDIGGAFFGITAAGTLANKFLDKTGEFTQKLEEAFQPTEDVSALKEEIGKSLEKLNRKILIVIDDIDRLNKKEIYEIFRLVKIIADFKNTIYILSYDKKNATSALFDHGYDERFIDKIVQHEFDIPKVSEENLSSFFDKALDEISKASSLSITEKDREHYGRLVMAGIKDPMINLRDAKRIINKLDFDYGCLNGEVNYLDLLGLTVLKLYCRPAYDFLFTNGPNYINPLSFSDKEDKLLYAGLKKDLPPDQKWAIKVLEEIFPLVIREVNDSSSATGKHLSSAEHFEKYFQLIVPSGHISDLEYDRVINNADNYNELTGIIMTYKEKGQDSLFLQGLRRRVDRFNQSKIWITIAAIIDVADLMNEEPAGFLSLSPASTAFSIALNLLNSVPKDNRADVFVQAVNDSKTGICHLADFIDYIGQDNGCIQTVGQHLVLQDGQKYLPQDKFEAAKGLCINRIANAKPEDIISKSGFTTLWMTLERWGYKNLSDLRSKLLTSSFLRVVRHYTVTVISSQKTYLQTQLDSIRIFMGENISDEKIIEKIKKEISLCSDNKLAGEVQEGIDNAKN